MTKSLEYYQKQKVLLQQELSEIDLRIETYSKNKDDFILVDSFKNEKRKLETQLKIVCKKERELNESKK